MGWAWPSLSMPPGCTEDEFVPPIFKEPLRSLVSIDEDWIGRGVVRKNGKCRICIKPSCGFFCVQSTRQQALSDETLITSDKQLVKLLIKLQVHDSSDQRAKSGDRRPYSWNWTCISAQSTAYVCCARKIWWMVWQIRKTPAIARGRRPSPCQND
jgi:hypothetical protein